jgi:acetyl esterase/lipase
MPLDPAAARLLNMLAAGADPAAEVGAPQHRRSALTQLAQLGAGRPDPSVIAEDLRLGTAPPLPGRLYTPADETGRLIVYLHGGGWVAGDLETHDNVCRALARESAAKVLAVAYRQPPEHRFPVAVEDAVAAFAWARAQAVALGAEPARVALAGDSAGAGLAAAAAAQLRAAQAPGPALLLLLCPILDVASEAPSRRTFARGYFLEPAQMAQDLADYLPDPALAVDPRVSPLREPDLAGFPPTQLHLAEYDPFRDEGLAYAARLRAAGVPATTQVHAGMIHYFYALPRAIPYARTALAQIGAGVREALRA